MRIGKFGSSTRADSYVLRRGIPLGAPPTFLDPGFMIVWILTI